MMAVLCKSQPYAQKFVLQFVYSHNMVFMTMLFLHFMYNFYYF